ncbi:hypothetical protein EV1_003785 [Malus domestica]
MLQFKSVHYLYQRRHASKMPCRLMVTSPGSCTHLMALLLGEKSGKIGFDREEERCRSGRRSDISPSVHLVCSSCWGPPSARVPAQLEPGEIGAGVKDAAGTKARTAAETGDCVVPEPSRLVENQAARAGLRPSQVIFF